MKIRHIKTLLVLFLLEGSLALILFLQKPSQSGRASFLNYSTSRLGIAVAVLTLLLAALVLLMTLYSNVPFSQRFSSSIHSYLSTPEDHLDLISLLLAAASLFSFEIYLIGYISLPIHILPLMIWLVLTCLQFWLVLRLAYQSTFRSRPSLWVKLRTRISGLTKTQRQVSIILFILGTLYFIAYIPANLGDTENMHTFYLSSKDEHVIYPSVIRLMTPGDDFSSTIFHLLIDFEWWYGYPYLPISAAPLILPRLIFGESFGDHVQLNLLLMRQFVSVLPMIASIALLVFLVTRYKSLILSVSMYIFLLLVPSVIKYNYRFWHPDSLILLLVTLTFFFLQRDGLRFKKNFYLAAITCALAAAIKLWGFFFFIVIAGYLLAGLSKKILTFKSTLLAGFSFIAVMGGTMLISSPAYLYPPAVEFLVNGWESQLSTNARGYDQPDPEGVYQTGLENWLKYFDEYYMRPWFFFFAFTALLLGSLWGSQTYLNRILLGWCLVTAIYLIYFVSVKSYQYMMPVMLPLYIAGFLLPSLADGKARSGWLCWLNKPLTRYILLGTTILLYSAQFVINLESIMAFPFMK